MYTKQELINAYCEATNYTPEKGTKAEYLASQEQEHQTFIDTQRAKLQAQLNQLPLTGKERMKRIALGYLGRQAVNQIINDNTNVTL